MRVCNAREKEKNCHPYRNDYWTLTYWKSHLDCSTQLNSIRFYFWKSNRSAVWHMCASIHIYLCYWKQSTWHTKPKRKKTVSHNTVNAFICGITIYIIHRAHVLSNTQHQKAFSISFPFIKCTSCCLPFDIDKIWLFESDGAVYTVPLSGNKDVKFIIKILFFCSFSFAVSPPTSLYLYFFLSLSLFHFYCVNSIVTRQTGWKIWIANRYVHAHRWLTKKHA